MPDPYGITEGFLAGQEIVSRMNEGQAAKLKLLALQQELEKNQLEIAEYVGTSQFRQNLRETQLARALAEEKHAMIEGELSKLQLELSKLQLEQAPELFKQKTAESEANVQQSKAATDYSVALTDETKTRRKGEEVKIDLDRQKLFQQNLGTVANLAGLAAQRELNAGDVAQLVQDFMKSQDDGQSDAGKRLAKLAKDPTSSEFKTFYSLALSEFAGERQKLEDSREQVRSVRETKFMESVSSYVNGFNVQDPIGAIEFYKEQFPDEAKSPAFQLAEWIVLFGGQKPARVEMTPGERKLDELRGEQQFTIEQQIANLDQEKAEGKISDSKYQREMKALEISLERLQKSQGRKGRGETKTEPAVDTVALERHFLDQDDATFEADAALVAKGKAIPGLTRAQSELLMDRVRRKRGR